MRKSVIAVIAACTLAGAFVVENARAEDAAPAVDMPCMRTTQVPEIEKFRVLSRDEWLAARVLFFDAPPTPSAFPPGDKAILRPSEDGGGAVFFVDGDKAFALMIVGKNFVGILEKIAKGEITHSSRPVLERPEDKPKGDPL